MKMLYIKTYVIYILKLYICILKYIYVYVYINIYIYILLIFNHQCDSSSPHKL